MTLADQLSRWDFTCICNGVWIKKISTVDVKIYVEDPLSEVSIENIVLTVVRLATRNNQNNLKLTQLTFEVQDINMYTPENPDMSTDIEIILTIVVVILSFVVFH